MYEHVKWRPSGYVGNLVLELDIPGRRPSGSPKTTWKDVVLMYKRGCNVSNDDIEDERIAVEKKGKLTLPPCGMNS